jgi:predicted Zn finger-like uncharacterized protein
MIVECGQCKTKFKVSDDKITPLGVKVRCSKCKFIFTVVKSKTEATPAIHAAKPMGERLPSQPPLGNRGFGQDRESKPIKEDASRSSSPHLSPFQLSQIPDKIDQQVVDQIDLDSDAPLSMFRKELPDHPQIAKPHAATPPTPAQNALDDLFGTLPAPQAVSENTLAPEISFDEPTIGQFSAKPHAAKPHAAKPHAAKPHAAKPHAAAGGNAAASYANANQNIDRDSLADSGSPPAADPFANLDVDVQLINEPHSAVAAGNASAETGGDLFHEIELDRGAFSATDLAQPQTPAEKELFSSLEDPFAGLPSAQSSPPPRSFEPPPLPSKPDGSSATNGAAQPGSTFDALDAAPQAVPTKKKSAFLVGNDPFADLEDYQATSSEGGSELTLDVSGKLVGNKVKTRPASSKAMGKEISADESPHAVVKPAPLQSMARSQTASENSRRLPLFYKIGVGGLVFVGLLLIFVTYRGGENPDLTNWSTYIAAFSGAPTGGEANGDLQAKNIATTTYHNLNGHPLLLFWGEVYNSSNESLTRVRVTGQLLSNKGQILGEYAGLAGVVFTPSEIYQMGDAQLVEAEYKKKIEGLEPKMLLPGGSLPFMIVAYEHPEITGEIMARVVPSPVNE